MWSTTSATSAIAIPSVVAALSAQAAELNTNTRYLHDNIVDYAARLTACFPGTLERLLSGLLGQ